MADGYEEISGGNHNPDDSGSDSGTTETGGGEVTGGQTEGGGSTEVGDSSGGTTETGSGGTGGGQPTIQDDIDTGAGTYPATEMEGDITLTTFYNDDIVDIDLSTGTVHRSYVNHIICEGDARINRYGARLYRGGIPFDLEDTQVTGYFIRPDGNTVIIDGGTLEGGNLALVRLPQACYAYTGNFTLAIKIHKGQFTGTVRIVDGTVVDTTTGTVVDPGRTIPDIDALLAAMAAAEAAGVSYTAGNGVQLTGGTKFELTNSALIALNRLQPFGLSHGESETFETTSDTSGWAVIFYKLASRAGGIKMAHLNPGLETGYNVMTLATAGTGDPLTVVYDSGWKLTNTDESESIRGFIIRNTVPVVRE